MPDVNPFADLIPKQVPPSVTPSAPANPFADLVPKKEAAPHPFADLVPPEKRSLLQAGLEGAYAPFKPIVDRAVQPAIDLYKEGAARQPTMPEKGETGGQFARRAITKDIPEGFKTATKAVGAGISMLPSVALAGTMGQETEKLAARAAGVPEKKAQELGQDVGDVTSMIAAPKAVGEKITSPAIKDGKKIYTGENHEVIRQKMPEGSNKGAKADTGFVTDKGRFVSRKEADKIAKAQGQFKQEVKGKDELHSEELAKPGETTPKQRTVSTFRAEEGHANRKIVQFENRLDQHYNAASELAKTPTENLAVHDYMQGREGAKLPPLKNPELQGMADDVRGVMKGMQKEIEAMDEQQKVSFYRDYFPNFFKQSEKAKAFVSQWVSRQGTGGNLLKRKYPTLRDGLEAGLEMEEPNIVKAASRYINRTAKFVGSQRIRQQMIKNGDAKWGAAAPHEGWEPLTGQEKTRRWVTGADQGDPQAAGYVEKLWAHPDAAKIYNNAYSPGFEATPLKSPYEALRSVTVANTAAELSLSLFHPQVLWGQSFFNDLARMGKNMALFDFKGTGAATKSLAAGRLPFMKGGNYRAGLRLMKQYKSLDDLGLDPHSILEHFEKGGGRVSQDPLYRGGAATATPALIRRTVKNPKEALRTGQNMLHEAVEARKKMFAEGNKLTETGKLGLDLLHNATEAAAYPLFMHYTPAIKLGAFEGMMSDWLRRNPLASDAAISAAREHYLDLVDERFGEMNMNNVFTSKYVKQMESLAFRAPGWLRGLARIHNYAYRDAYQLMKDATKGKFDEKNLDRPLFLLSAIGGGMLINGAYQYLKTGQQPDGLDWFAPRTGGTSLVAKGTRYERKDTERVTLPLTAHFKELVRMYTPAFETMRAYSTGKPLPVDSPLSGVADEIKNKFATFPRSVIELGENQNYRGDTIYDATGQYGALGGMGEAAGHVAGGFVPFNLTSQHAEQPGSALTGFERRGMGLYPAGMQIRNPEGYAAMRRAMEEKRQKKTQEHNQ